VHLISFPSFLTPFSHTRIVGSLAIFLFVSPWGRCSGPAGTVSVRRVGSDCLFFVSFLHCLEDDPLYVFRFWSYRSVTSPPNIRVFSLFPLQYYVFRILHPSLSSVSPSARLWVCSPYPFLEIEDTWLFSPLLVNLFFLCLVVYTHWSSSFFVHSTTFRDIPLSPFSIFGPSPRDRGDLLLFSPASPASLPLLFSFLTEVFFPSLGCLPLLLLCPSDLEMTPPPRDRCKIAFTLYLTSLFLSNCVCLISLTGWPLAPVFRGQSVSFRCFPFFPLGLAAACCPFQGQLFPPHLKGFGIFLRIAVKDHLSTPISRISLNLEFLRLTFYPASLPPIF